MQISGDQESQIILSTKIHISEQLRNLFPPMTYPNSLAKEVRNLATLSRTVKSDVARWIRQNLMMRLLDDGIVESPDADEQRTMRSDSSTTNIISLEQFLVIRHALEELEDYSIFADVLNMVSDRVLGPLMTAVADTVNFYFEVFNAIGAADDIFRKLLKRVEVYRREEVERASLESLIDLGCRLPKADQEVQRLRQEIAAQMTRCPAAACSPISDTMVEAVQSIEPAYADEMDQILASGTSMDKRTLTRVFGTLIIHLEKSFGEASHLVIRFSQLLATLRSFGARPFDALFNDWLHEWLQSNASKGLFRSLAPVICLEVVSLGAVLQAIIRAIDAVSDQHRKAGLVLDTFEFIVGALSESMTTVDYRRYRIFDQLQATIRTAPIAIIDVLVRVAGVCQSRDHSTRIRAASQTKSHATLDLIQSSLLWHSKVTPNVDCSVNDFNMGSDLKNLVGAILILDHSGGSKHLDSRADILSILSKVNDFNVSLTGLRLRAILTLRTTPLQDAMDALSAIIIERVIASSDDGVHLWACLVSRLSANQASSVRELAEGKLLTWAINHTDSTLADPGEQVSSLISIIEASTVHTPVIEISPFVERIADTLTNITAGVQFPSYEQHLQTESDVLFRRIDVLLRLLIIHQSTIQHAKCPQKIICSLLIALGLLLVNPLLALHPTLSHQIFDILCLFSDSASDDTRSRCIHRFRNEHGIRDSRLQFIFGDTDVIEGEWLQLVTKPSSAITSRPGAASSITSRPYPLRRWEMMQDATPVAAENDTSLSLTLFGSKKSVL